MSTTTLFPANNDYYSTVEINDPYELKFFKIAFSNEFTLTLALNTSYENLAILFDDIIKMDKIVDFIRDQKLLAAEAQEKPNEQIKPTIRFISFQMCKKKNDNTYYILVQIDSQLVKNDNIIRFVVPLQGGPVEKYQPASTINANEYDPVFVDNFELSLFGPTGKDRKRSALVREFIKRMDDARKESDLRGKTVTTQDVFDCKDDRTSNFIPTINIKNLDKVLHINVFRSSFLGNGGLREWLGKNKDQMKHVFDDVVLFYLKPYVTGVLKKEEKDLFNNNLMYVCYAKIVSEQIRHFIKIKIKDVAKDQEFVVVVPLEHQDGYKVFELDEFIQRFPDATYVGNYVGDGLFVSLRESYRNMVVSSNNYYDNEGKVVGKGGSKKHKSKRRRNQSVKGSHKQKQRRTKRKQ